MIKVLVVEDETLLRSEVVEWLTFEGYEATGAKDGVAGLEAVQRQMLDDMLVVAQMDNGKLDFKPEPINMGDFFQGLVDEFRTLDNNAHPITLENHCEKWVMADSRLLRQIASNLISNALKYSPPGSQIGVGLEQDAEASFVLTVHDQGIGIPEEEQTHILEPFTRASNVGRINGTGLGLAITKQAVELHQGNLRLKSQPGLGTTIVVSLPT